jgi:hypothetical protein
MSIIMIDESWPTATTRAQTTRAGVSQSMGRGTREERRPARELAARRVDLHRVARDDRRPHRLAMAAEDEAWISERFVELGALLEERSLEERGEHLRGDGHPQLVPLVEGHLVDARLVRLDQLDDPPCLEESSIS